MKQSIGAQGHSRDTQYIVARKQRNPGRNGYGLPNRHSSMDHFLLIAYEARPHQWIHPIDWNLHHTVTIPVGPPGSNPTFNTVPSRAFTGPKRPEKCSLHPNRVPTLPPRPVHQALSTQDSVQARIHGRTNHMVATL